MADLALIKKLREATGCGISDCNKALSDCGDDFEKSVDWLRKKGLSAAVKKGGRIAAEGLVAVYVAGKKASIIELNSETDFVARNDKFQALVAKLVKSSIAFDGDIEKFKATTFEGLSISVDEEIKNQIGVIGENINLRRIDSVSVENGSIVSYIHNTIAPNMGKIAVLIALESKASADKLEELGKQISMHIAATKPESLTIENLDPEKLNRETEILKEQARASGKPESIIDKMIQGRIRKYYEEVVLLEQNFVMDDKKKIKDVIADFSKENGETKISAFKLFVLGEGIEKKAEDFAAEVASMTKN
ncbi:MAG TPA: translation elongation factor Ts [Rickettsiales bacterium]|nr:translation elongation factor Ts [Rickettsiales bacterium]